MRMQSKWTAICLALAMATAWLSACGREESKPGMQTSGKGHGVTLVKSETATGDDNASAPENKPAIPEPNPPAPAVGAPDAQGPEAAPGAPALPAAQGVPGAPVAPNPMAPGGGPALEAPAANPKSIALRYSVLLENDPTMRLYAPENMTFASGQKFRIMLVPSQDLYLYMINEGTDGQFAWLAPLPGQGTSLDRLTGGATAVLPLTGNYGVDQKPGMERIHVIAATHKVERVEQLLETGREANDSARISQMITAIHQRQEVGYEINKKTDPRYSELTLTGDDPSRSFIIGTINIKHQ
ncbi:MAG: DUF4384 domain-containing protein [Candidatus Sumerlaeota bacterium]|nr:DUF4384 domain-containing protein [Candidatus Sumerlaeota bacterium]